MTLFQSGVSTIVRAAERQDPGLDVLRAEFARAGGCETHLQVYATPAGTSSFGWHFDFEDVFIVQTAGTKDYYFRENTTALDAVLGDELNFAAVLRERSSIFTARLVAGDWLYIPSRWWHQVKCLETSLSISIGLMPAVEIARASRVPAGWRAPSAPAGLGAVSPRRRGRDV